MNPVSNAQAEALRGREHDRRHHHRLHPMEWLTIVHVSGFVIAATWAFGGQSDAVRPMLTAWGWLGALITLAALLKGDQTPRSVPKLLWWSVPVVLFNAVVLVASMNPSFRAVRDGADTMLVNTGGIAALPSSARPALARQALVTFDAIWISCFNLALVLRRRRAIRIVLSVVALNAVVLAIFGTAQRLFGSHGIFFGAVHTPQPYFFATFVYHNHWGAFILLMLGVVLALMIYHARRRHWRDFFHSPTPSGLLALLLLGLTVPLSASRSSTVLMLILLGGAFAHWTIRVVRLRRQFNESVAPPLAGASVALLLGLTGLWFIAGPTITRRVALTERQIDYARMSATRDARVQLYSDTWHMARAKPWFGWGMASYPYVFTLYNTRTSVDGLPVFYHDAHSDWLQAVAEHGFIGTSLLILCAAVPLLSVRRRYLATPIPGYLLAGCGIIVVYATLEFPFGNFAVVLCWWTCFMCAVQYARLTALKSGSADPFPASA